MEHENLYDRLDEIVKEIRRIGAENPIKRGKPIDPRVVQLILEGHRIKKELDPLVRATFRNRPKELARWNTIARTFDHLDEFEKEWGITADSLVNGPDEEADPRTAELIADADRILREKLDPMAREAFRDHAKALADWERVMKMYYDLDKEEPELNKSDS